MSERSPAREIRKWKTGHMAEGPNVEEVVEGEAEAAHWFKSLKQRLASIHKEISAESKVLEVGSGDGTYLSYLHSQGIEAVAIDARPRGKEKTMVAAARIEQLPFADSAFDIVLSAWVFDTKLYHQDQEKMMQEIVRVLKPGGIYLGLEPERNQELEIRGLTIVSDLNDPRPPLMQKM